MSLAEATSCGAKLASKSSRKRCPHRFTWSSRAESMLGNSQCGDSGGGGGGVESDESGMDFTNRAKHDLLAYQRVEKTLEAFIMQSQICSFL